MGKLKSIIQFYRDCYQFENKGVKINNFFTKECGERFIPETLELIQGKSFGYPVSTEWGKSVESILLLDSKEKALQGGSIFIKATINRIGKKITCYTPLYIHALKLSNEGGVYFLKIEETFANPIFIECLNSIDENLDAKFDEFIEKIPPNPFGFENTVKLENSLKKHLPTWDTSDLEYLHDSTFNNNEYTLKTKKARANKKHIYANLIFGIFARPAGSRGVISELNILSKKDIQSKLLNNFFSITPIESRAPKVRSIFAPTNLSEAQKEVFYKLNTNDINLVIGPPGTGKSYTIAALTIDQLSMGRSVLIASKNNQAGKVIADKIEKDFGIKNLLIKTKTQNYKRSLITKLSKLIYGINRRMDKINIKDIEQEILSLQKQIDDSTSKLVSLEEKEIKWGAFYYKNKSSFFTAFKSKWIEYQKRNTIPIWKINAKISSSQKNKISSIKLYLKLKYDQKIATLLETKREDFVKLIEALKEESGNALQAKFENINFDLILNALPAWICNTQDISRILPLNNELFDVVIIDEASQCDIATMIPVLYRAKKVIVVGDPNQLKHYSFLSDHRQSELKAKYKLDASIPNYRKASLIDLTSKIIGSQHQITFLDEHYRSKPDIIRFSNNRIYDSHLKLMRSTPTSNLEINNSIISVQGTRNSKGVNEKEANSILLHINEIILREKELSSKMCNKIGILSPFQEQTKFIKSIIRKNINNTNISKHDILIGTPYHFQGEERDIMFISFTIDDLVHPAVYNYLNKEDVFNVAITRARNLQFIYTSIDYKKNKETHLITQYLNDISGAHINRNEKVTNISHDNFTDDVIQSLNSAGIDKIHRSCFISGVRVDLAIVHKGNTYAIDLIGYPGAFIQQFTPESIQMLKRMNHPIFFVPYSSWVLEKEKVKKDLYHFLGV